MKRFIQTITRSLAALAMVIGLASFTVSLQSSVAMANSNEVQQGINSVGGNEGGNRAGDFTSTITNIINLLLFIIGVISVIFIILGGIRFVTSQGDSSQVSSARNTILYAVIGLVVAMMAFAIVNWVVGEIR